MDREEGMKGKFLNVLGLLLGIAAGVGLLFMLVSTRPESKKRRPPDLRPIAEVKTVIPQTYEAIVEGYGTVRPSETLNVVSEAGGMIIEQGEDVAEGSLLERDSLLFRIDSSSIVAEIEQLEAQIAAIDAQIAEIGVQSESDRKLLEIEEKVFEVAQRDYERSLSLFKKKLISEQAFQANEARKNEQLLALEKRRSALSANVHKVAVLKANRRAAIAARKAKKVVLTKTVLRAPYKCRVVSVHARLYQAVQPGAVLATIYPVDAPTEVSLPVESRHLSAFFDFDNLERGRPPWKQVKLKADVFWQHFGEEQNLSGYLSRIGAQRDPNVRTITVIIELPGPMERAQRKGPRGLLPGTFVKVAIHGRGYENVMVIPERALVTDHSVFVVEEGALKEVKIQPLLVLDHDVIVPVTQSLPAGSKVVLTEVAGAFEGMQVRIIEEKAETG
jgi:hypothetical protein